MKRLMLMNLVLILLMGLSGCKLLKTPRVEKIQDIRVGVINPDKSTLKLSLIVHNPNCHKLRVQKLDVTLLNKDRGKVGFAKLTKEVTIPKNASVNIDFDVELDTRPVVKMVSSIDQQVQFFVTGEGKGKALGISKKFSFDEPYSLSLKEHLETLLSRFTAQGQSLFKIQKTSVEKIDLGQTELHVSFLILNPYGLSFNLKGFPSEIYINGKSVGTGNLNSQLRFDETIFSQEGVMIFKLSNLKSVLGAVKGVFKGEVAYQVKGKVMIDALGMDINEPFQYSDAIPLNLWELLLN